MNGRVNIIVKVFDKFQIIVDSVETGVSDNKHCIPEIYPDGQCLRYREKYYYVDDIDICYNSSSWVSYSFSMILFDLFICESRKIHDEIYSLIFRR